MKTTPPAIIEAKFTMNFTPDKYGKLSTEVQFSFPGVPDGKVPDNIRKMVIEDIEGLCKILKTQIDDFSE